MKYFILNIITLLAILVGYATRDIHLIGVGLGLVSCVLAGLVFLFIIVLVIRKDEFSGAVVVFYTFLSLGLAMIFSPIVDDHLENRIAHEQVGRIYSVKLKTGSFPEKWECDDL